MVTGAVRVPRRHRGDGAGMTSLTPKPGLAPARPTVPHHRFLLSRLQREWNALSRRPAVLARASAWQLAEAPLSSLDELLVRTGLGSPAADPSFDVTLAALVAIARHDDLAARVVLQRMLPGLSATARRYSSSFEQSLDTLDELLSEAWPVIRSFPIETRSRYVIKNLLRDCEYRAFLKAKRRLLVHELTDPAQFDWSSRAVGAGGTGDEGSAEPMSVLVELLHRARAAGMSDDDITLVTTLLNTRTVKEAAARLRVTDRTVRNRRKLVVAQLRALADVA
jgi:hypothetical protein